MTERSLKCFKEIDQIVDSIFYKNILLQKNVKIRIRNSIVLFVQIKKNESFLYVINFEMQT